MTSNPQKPERPTRSQRNVLAGKTLTTTEAGLRLNAALARCAGVAASAFGAHVVSNTAHAFAASKEVASFKVWCEVMEIDPQPSLDRMDRSLLPVEEFLSRERSRLATEKLENQEAEAE